MRKNNIKANVTAEKTDTKEKSKEKSNKSKNPSSQFVIWALVVSFILAIKNFNILSSTIFAPNCIYKFPLFTFFGLFIRFDLFFICKLISKKNYSLHFYIITLIKKLLFIAIFELLVIICLLSFFCEHYLLFGVLEFFVFWVFIVSLDNVKSFISLNKFVNRTFILDLLCFFVKLRIVKQGHF